MNPHSTCTPSTAKIFAIFLTLPAVYSSNSHLACLSCCLRCPFLSICPSSNPESFVRNEAQVTLFPHHHPPIHQHFMQIVMLSFLRELCASEHSCLPVQANCFVFEGLFLDFLQIFPSKMKQRKDFSWIFS